MEDEELEPAEELRLLMEELGGYEMVRQDEDLSKLYMLNQIIYTYELLKGGELTNEESQKYGEDILAKADKLLMTV